jgi:hypothetical protein
MILDSITALGVIARSDSDEAIQTFSAASGLLRFARNDDPTRIHQILVCLLPGQA